ncbi:hypothetical protein [Streptomyces sp. NBC_01236]|uniref:hypothetical protein n=1 Tax=Streptomyces sp. NBC_01236 TaxID=2903789 RepID=UPI002E14F988|nr:hypothetical protein OG324_40965 [Streptomyces sp. NBC_01236]
MSPVFDPHAKVIIDSWASLMALMGNTTLKRQLNLVTQEHRSLQERLQGARSNLRFTEKRVANLEVELSN